MNNRWWVSVVSLALLAATGPAAEARGLGVEVWTDRGDDAVYQPGDLLDVRARATEDTYLLVYEIDAEGYVRLLYPYRGSSGYVEGRRTYAIPPEEASVDLVVQRSPVGQCYVVAIASRDRFRELPWYLRPYDLQAENVGYEGMRDDEEGITAEGRIVGDPFVAMERIRRRVVENDQDPDAFATSYVTYYVHTEVRYPRYLCYDCHRPGRWAWWTGFDPYYTHCSVFDFRINWGWGWGPSYWYGCVPYYYYVVRPSCPPYYRPFYQDHYRFSSWDGWRRFKGLWGSHLVRHKSNPPPGYVPPPRNGGGVKWWNASGRAVPPGFVASDIRKGREGPKPRIPIGRGYESRPREPRPREEAGTRTERPHREVAPRDRTPREERPGYDRPREEAPRHDRPRREVAPRDPAPREERPRYEPAPRYERPRHEPAPAPRQEAPRYEKPRHESAPAPREHAPRYERPRQEPPRHERPSGDQGSGRRRDDGASSSGRAGSRYKG